MMTTTDCSLRLALVLVSEMEIEASYDVDHEY